MKTLGESRVRTTFNPSSANIVDEIKQKSAELIDLCETLRSNGSASYTPGGEEERANKELQRLVSLAQTDYENAAMWAVKAATIEIPVGK